MEIIILKEERCKHQNIKKKQNKTNPIAKQNLVYTHFRMVHNVHTHTHTNYCDGRFLEPCIQIPKSYNRIKVMSSKHHITSVVACCWRQKHSSWESGKRRHFGYWSDQASTSTLALICSMRLFKSFTLLVNKS